MELSDALLSKFAKEVKAISESSKPADTGVSVEGTAKAYQGTIYVQLDGSDQLTPVISSTTGMKDGDRVTVLIKDHSAMVTGNVSSPSAGQDDIDQAKQEISDTIAEFEIVIADKVSTEEFDAEKGRIDQLTADTVNIKEQLTATNATIETLEADNVTINEKLTAAEADIDDLTANMLTAEAADIKYATIENLEATNADIHNLTADYGDFKVLATDKFTATDASIANLETTKLSAEQADLKYANIDFANIGSAAIENFFSKSGMIGDLVVGDGTITGTLVGVTIKGDLIEGGTVKADKLVVQGEDGLYYKLNVTGETVSAEQTEYNSLNGSIITAKSITAEKISVNDLVAFGATIGGFHITDSSLYSGTKSSIDNTTRGTYMDDQGQIAIGDQSNYLKFFKDTDGTWKLQIAANSIKMGASGSSLEETIEEINNKVDDIEIGGRNLVKDTNKGDTHWAASFGNGAGTKSSATFDDLNGVNGVRFDVTTKPTNWAYLQYTDDTLRNIFANSLGERYTISFDIKTDGSETASIEVSYKNGNALDTMIIFGNTKIIKNEWTHVTLTGKVTGTTISAQVIYIHVLNLIKQDATFFEIANLKIEKGNKATDWTPAPEDVDQSISNAQTSADSAQDSANNAIDRVTTAESSIEILRNSITSLVTDANGSSLMTQTSDGWTFNIGSLQSDVQKNATMINEVIGDVTQVEQLAQHTSDLVNDITEKTAYITMSQDDEGDPCILLGRSDSPFKLRITNTSIDFMEGTARIAYVTNHQLYIESSVVTDEMKVGATDGFIWKKRGNGNMGLRWEAN